MSTSSKRGLSRGLGALGLGGPVPVVAPAPEVQTENPAPPEETRPTSNGEAPVVAPNGNGSAPAPSASRNALKTGLDRVPITSIAPNPYQPRKHIDPDILAELAQSIRENGLIQPPVVSYNPDYDPDYKPTDEEETGPVKKERKARFLLIAGERRWQASKLAGLVEIPVFIKEATPLQMLELALVENIQRADLNPLEEADAYRQLMQEFKLTQEAVAQRVGKSRAAVANSLRLFDLPAPILDSVYKGLITEGHARALLMVQDKGDLHRLHHDVIAKQYSVRQTEETARRLNAQRATAGYLDVEEKPVLSPAQRETRELEEHFRLALETKVSLTRSIKGDKQSGKLVIEFFSKEELNEIYSKIVKPEI